MADTLQLRLVESGPLWRAERRLGLVSANGFGARRVAAFVGFAWLPLLVLVLIDQLRLRAPMMQIFSHDLANHARLLVGVPTLLYADRIIGSWCVLGSRRFRSEKIREKDLGHFDGLVQQMNRLAASRVAEACVLAVAVLASGMRARSFLGGNPSAWYAMNAGGHVALTFAGIWFFGVGMPLSFFLAGRWVWRYALWTFFLLAVSRMPLRLNATHPDCRGGLAFLADCQLTFSMIPFAFSAVLAGGWASRIAWGGDKLEHFIGPLAMLAVASLAVFVSPLCAFAPQLRHLRLKYVTRFDEFSFQATESFDKTWLGPERREKPLSDDVQNLANLADEFSNVHSVNVVPFGLQLMVGFLIPTLMPMVAPIAVSASATELLKTLAKALL